MSSTTRIGSPGLAAGAGGITCPDSIVTAALAALAEFDRDDTRDGGPTPERRQERSALVAQASVALWHFVVQREACGLRDMRHVLRDYRVPPEVAARMGVLPIGPVRVRKTDRRP